MDAFSPRAAWFLGVDLGALLGLLVLVVSTKSLFGSLSWPVSIVADWLILARVGRAKVHRVQFVRGVLQGYLIPVSIGLAVFVAVAAYYLVTRGTLTL
jgi:hypothetical protein